MILSKHEIHIIPAISITIRLLLITHYLNKILQRTIKKLGDTHNLEVQLIRAVQILTRVFVYSIGITLCLENLHVQLSALFGTLGVVAIGVGFALQNALANMTSGIFILYYKPFFVGDYVSFETIESDRITEGTITDINLRITTLELNNDKILVPNHAIYSAVVTVRKK